MGFESDGYLVTDSRSEDDGDTLAWDTTSDWEGYQDAEDIKIDSGVVKLATGIPDSAIHQYKLDEGSGSTAADSIGDNDLAISGASWYSNGFTGGYALDFDGTDDEAVGDYIPECGGESAFSIAFTLDLDKCGDRDADDTKTEILQNMKNSDRDDSIGISFGNDDSTVGDIEVDLRDGDSNRVDGRLYDVSDESGLIRVVYTWDGSGTGNMYVDTVEDSTGGASPAGNITGVSGGSMTFASTDGGEYGDVALDNVIFYDSELTSSEVQDDYDAQPWT